MRRRCLSSHTSSQTLAWAALKEVRHFTRRVAKEEREGQGLSLHHAATRGQYLSDAPDLLEVAFTKGAGNNGGSDNTCAWVVGGACGVSTKHQVASVHDMGLAPYPLHAGRGSTRRKGRESRVFRGRQAADPQRFSGPPGLELLPVGRRGGAPSTPPLALKQDVPEVGRFVTQRASALGAFRGGEKSPLPYHAQSREVVGALRLRLCQSPGNRPVHTTDGASPCILLGNAAVSRRLE